MNYYSAITLVILGYFAVSFFSPEAFEGLAEKRVRCIQTISAQSKQDGSPRWTKDEIVEMCNKV